MNNNKTQLLKSTIINKRTRNFVFLLITVIIIFAINALLPTIEGNTHYTADPIETTYKEYLIMKEDNAHYVLTWSSEEEINKYISQYRELNEVPPYVAVEVPDDFIVKIYTKFFFQHSFWYITTITHVVSAVMLFYAIFNYLNDKNKEEYSKYINLDNDLTTLSNNSLDPSSFEPWMISVFNKDRKIKQHISNVRYKLSLLEERTSYKVRNSNKNTYRYRRYITKKNNLNQQLSEEYINNVVEHKKVKHFKFIHPTFVTCGVNHLGKTVDSYSILKSNSSRLSRDAIQKTLTSLLLTVMFASLLTMTVVTAADKPWYWVVIDIIATIAPLIMQIPLAFDYCATYMEDQLIPNLISRKTIALLYLAYKKGVNDGETTNTRRD